MLLFGISDWIILLGTLLGVAWYYFWKKTQYFKDRNIISADGIPVFGDTLRLFLQMEHVKDFLEKVYKKYSDQRYVGMMFFLSPVVVVNDLDLTKQILVKDFDHFTDHIQFADPESDPVTARMLFLLQGEQWREMRNTLSPAFTSLKMRGMFPFMKDCASNLIQYVDKIYTNRTNKGKDFVEMEMKDTFTRCTNDIIASCGFGIHTNSLVDTENTFYKMSKAFTTADVWENIKLGIFSFLPFLTKLLKLKFGKESVNRFFNNLIISNMKEREEKNIVRPDMIHLLMLAKRGKLSDETDGKDEAKRKTKLEWSNDDIVAQVLIFLFAGFDSTATMLSFLAYELAKATEVQQKLQKEIDDLMEKSNGQMDYDGINNLKYLDMVCSETLRLWPVAPSSDRVCTKPYTLPPQNDKDGKTLQLNKGDQIWLPTMSIHRDPKYFPNPDKFDPERFSDANKDSIVPFSYNPFGMGPRQCIGIRFALMEVKILIANLVTKFDLIKTDKTPDPMVLRNSVFDMVAMDGHWIGLRPRKI